MDDLFALQNEITSRIAITLNLEFIAAEAARPTERPDAVAYALRGRATWLKPRSQDTYEEAISLFEQALTLNPQSVEAQSWLASELASRVLDGLTDSAAVDIARAERLSAQALTTAPRSPHAHFARGQVLRAQRRPEQAISEYEAAIAFNRNHVNALAAVSWCKLYTGSVDQVIPVLEQVIRLSPRDPNIGAWRYRIGLAHLVQSRTDEAILWFERARSAMPGHPALRASLASAYALKGEAERAVAELTEARRLSGDDRYLSVARLKTVGYFGVPEVRALFEATFFAGLRRVGVPEE